MKTNSNYIYFITFNRAYNINFEATELLNGKGEDGNLVKVMKIIMAVKTMKMKKKNLRSKMIKMVARTVKMAADY